MISTIEIDLEERDKWARFLNARFSTKLAISIIISVTWSPKIRVTVNFTNSTYARNSVVNHAAKNIFLVDSGIFFFLPLPPGGNNFRFTDFCKISVFTVDAAEFQG